MGARPHGRCSGIIPPISRGLPEGCDARKAADESTDTAYRTHTMVNDSTESAVDARECGGCRHWCDLGADALLMNDSALLNEDRRTYG